MNVAIAKPVKVPDWKSHKASALDTELRFATRFHGVASHDDEIRIRDLLKSRSHGRAEAEQNDTASRTIRSGVCEIWGDEKAKSAHHIRKFDQRLERSPQ